MDDQHRIRDCPKPEKREHFLTILNFNARKKPKLRNWEF